MPSTTYLFYKEQSFPTNISFLRVHFYLRIPFHAIFVMALGKRGLNLIDIGIEGTGNYWRITRIATSTRSCLAPSLILLPCWLSRSLCAWLVCPSLDQHVVVGLHTTLSCRLWRTSTCIASGSISMGRTGIREEGCQTKRNMVTWWIGPSSLTIGQQICDRSFAK